MNVSDTCQVTAILPAAGLTLTEPRFGFGLQLLLDLTCGLGSLVVWSLDQSEPPLPSDSCVRLAFFRLSTERKPCWWVVKLLSQAATSVFRHEIK